MSKNPPVLGNAISSGTPCGLQALTTQHIEVTMEEDIKISPLKSKEESESEMAAAVCYAATPTDCELIISIIIKRIQPLIT